jgi:hypothetical protein
VVSTSGDYTHTYTGINGCDSVVTAHVTINQAISSSFNASACTSYTLPWSVVVTTSGDYTHTYTGVNGCDSVVTAHVTINTAPVVAAITGTTSISTGGTTQLSDATAGGVWSSNNTSVATVNASGLVTGVSSGSATISYKVTNSCGTTTVTAVVSVSQSLIQGTIKSGTSPNDIEVWLKPNFSNSTQYLFQIGMPIAYPASASVQPTSLNVTLDPGFVSAFGNNYSVTVNPIAQNTGGTEKYFNIVLIRGGVGASNPQNWTAGVEFKVLTASFVPATAPGTAVKLADYQDGGSDGQGNFYTQDGNSNYYITSNSVGNFYASPGQSTVGGTASAGYAQTIASVGCTMPVVAAISGSSTVCAGSSTQLSDATSGGVWSSNNTSVATVNGSGLVSGVLAGSATISYAIINSCGTTTVTKIITVNQGTTSSFNASGCNNYTLPWSTVVTTSGDYTHTYAATNGCDSVVTAHVTINQSTSSSFTASGCGSYVLPWSTVVTTSGNYAHTYTAINGCDSIVTAHITINQATSSSFNASGCGSYTLPWSTVVTTSGDYTHTYTGVNGCDSVVTAHITIGTSLTSSFSASGCGSYTLPWSAVVTTSGDYTHTYQTIGGCDSVVTAHITINQSTSSSFNATACNSYSLPWGGSVTTSGNYVHTYTGINGCDSVVTAHVTINHGNSSTTNISICASALPYTWNENSYPAGGTYTVHFTNAVGCDSAATLVLTILPNVSAGTVSGTSPLSVGATATYTSNGTAGGSWSSSNTSVATVNASSGLVSALSAGTTNIIYTVNSGCGSPVSSFKTLTVNPAASITVNCPGNLTATTTTCSKSLATSNPTYTGPVVALTWSMSGATGLSSGATGINFVGTKTFNVGVTTVTYTVKDASGNTAVCSFTVTVKESKAPTISCPGSITQNTATGLCSKTIAVANPSVSDNCGVVSVSWVMSGATIGSSPTTGINYVGTQTFNKGTTTITYTVKDASGNSASCSFTVKVVDTQAPQISCPGDITTTMTSGCSKSISVPNPVYSDNCGSVTLLSWAMIGATNAISPLTGINTIGTRTFNVGTTYVGYLITDASGNVNACSFTVTVLDNVNPTISCPGNITQTISGNKCNTSITTANPTFSDNCGVSKLTWVMSGATTGSSSSSGINYVGSRTFNVGITTVTYTVKDGSGNSASCSYTVKVMNSRCPNSPARKGNDEYTGSWNRNDLDVSVMPNPSEHQFRIVVRGEDVNSPISLRVMDVNGKVIEVRRGLVCGQTIVLGDLYKNGVYMVELVQGDRRKVVRLVKL